MLAPQSIFASSYRIERHLKSGGMGSVYVATHLGTGRMRALKIMQPGLIENEIERARFVQEARIGASIPSAHVVEVVDAGIEPSLKVPYIVMELLEGEDLASYVRREGARSFEEVRQLAIELGHVLGLAHSAHVVHRDLKPENLFLAVSRTATGGRMLKVLDFGIAKVIEETGRTTAGIGTPLWAAPEQLARGHVGPWTDVWAVGLVFFWLLTGRSYWRSVDAVGSGSLADVIQEITSSSMVPCDQRGAELGFHVFPGLAAWFDCCLRRAPQERFPDGGTALRAFAALSEGLSPIVARDGHPQLAQMAFAPTESLLPAGSGSFPGQPSTSPAGTITPNHRSASSSNGGLLALVLVGSALGLGALGLGGILAYRRLATTEPPPQSSTTPTGLPAKELDAAPDPSAAAPPTSTPTTSHHVSPPSRPSSSSVTPTSSGDVSEISFAVLGTGGLTAVQVRKSFALAAARQCFVPFFAQNPTIRGRLILTMEIGTNGKVFHSTNGGVGDPPTIACVGRGPQNATYPQETKPTKVEWILEISGPQAR